jgi:hypothetical protein
VKRGSVAKNPARGNDIFSATMDARGLRDCLTLARHWRPLDLAEFVLVKIALGILERIRSGESV